MLKKDDDDNTISSPHAQHHIKHFKYIISLNAHNPILLSSFYRWRN